MEPTFAYPMLPSSQLAKLVVDQRQRLQHSIRHVSQNIQAISTADLKAMSNRLDWHTNVNNVLSRNIDSRSQVWRNIKERQNYQMEAVQRLYNHTISENNQIYNRICMIDQNISYVQNYGTMNIDEMNQQQLNQLCERMGNGTHSRREQKYRYARRVPTPSHLIGQSCVICLQEYTARDMLIGLECDHYYHDHCMALELKGRNRCPLCQQQI